MQKTIWYPSLEGIEILTRFISHLNLFIKVLKLCISQFIVQSLQLLLSSTGFPVHKQECQYICQIFSFEAQHLSRPNEVTFDFILCVHLKTKRHDSSILIFGANTSFSFIVIITFIVILRVRLSGNYILLH